MNKIALYLSLLSLSSVPLMASSARFTSSATTSTSAATADIKVPTNIVRPTQSYLQKIKRKMDKEAAVRAFRAEIKGCKAAEVPKRRGEGYLRVVTYNVHMFKDPISKESNWDDVCANIKALDADVLILQEATPYYGEDNDDTRKGFSDNYYCYFAKGKASSNRTNELGNMILVRKSVPVVENKRPDHKRGIFGHNKIYNPDENRSAVQVELNLQKLGCKNNLIIFGTHLNNTNEKGEQEAEARVLCELANKDDTKGKNVIIAADFNAKAYSDTMKVFDKNFMKSSFDMAGITEDLYFTHMYADVIDRILLKNGYDYISKLTRKSKHADNTWSLPIVGCYILYDAASDHLPVVTDFKLR